MVKVGESLITAVGAVSWRRDPIVESIWGLWWAKYAACNAARYYWNSGTTAGLEEVLVQLAGNLRRQTATQRFERLADVTAVCYEDDSY